MECVYTFSFFVVVNIVIIIMCFYFTIKHIFYVEKIRYDISISFHPYLIYWLYIV